MYCKVPAAVVVCFIFGRNKQTRPTSIETSFLQTELEIGTILFFKFDSVKGP